MIRTTLNFGQETLQRSMIVSGAPQALPWSLEVLVELRLPSLNNSPYRSCVEPAWPATNRLCSATGRKYVVGDRRKLSQSDIS